MKKVVFLLVLLFASINIFGQLGYRYGSSFIELYPDNNSLYYVQTKDAGQMSYNSGIVISELLRRMPVIISAYAEDVAPLGFHLYYNKGHVFLIDGYKRFQKKYYNTYIYVYPEGVPRPDTAEYETVVSFSAPSIELFAMNWGKWDFNNKHWYAPTGDWSVKGDNYQYKRKMVYGFSNLN